MDYLDQMNKTVKESQERWKEIEGLCTVIQNEINTYDPPNHNVANLLLLLVAYLRPMNPSQDQMAEVTKGLGNLLSAFQGRRK